MKKLQLVLITIAALLLLSGCGTKRQSFEPEMLAGEVDYDGDLPAEIIDVARDGATLENGQIITKEGLLNVRLPQGFMFLGAFEGKYLAASRCGKFIVIDKSSKTLYEKQFDSLVASASLKNDILAIVLSNNDLLLIDITNDTQLFKQAGGKVYAHDSRIAPPYFLNALLIYPTLDGKLIIVDTEEKKVLREVVVKSEKFFSNVIYLDVLNDRLVAATRQRVVSINPKSMAYLDEDVRDVIILENRVLVFTKDGRIVLTDADLKVQKERKFNFASFSGTIYGEFIYVVENGGYLIATDIDLITSNVYELPDEIDSFMFTTDDTFYFKDQYFKLAKTKK